MLTVPHCASLVRNFLVRNFRVKSKYLDFERLHLEILDFGQTVPFEKFKGGRAGAKNCVPRKTFQGWRSQSQDLRNENSELLLIISQLLPPSKDL